MFFLVLAVAVNCVSGVFGIDDTRSYKNLKSLRMEKKGSIDAVFIGASNVMAFWQPVFGWADHGIAVSSLSYPGITCAAIKHMIIEARKTQPDALYIINLGCFKNNHVSLEAPQLHRVIDYTPFSLSKLNMVHDLVKKARLKAQDALEYYLPIIRFHSRWDELPSWVFSDGSTVYKLSYKTSGFSNKAVNITDHLALENDVRTPISEDMSQTFEELLDYCDSRHVNALFVKSPRVLGRKQQGRLNALEDILAQRGYPCLDLMEDVYDIGIDPRTDFYNAGHTNIHGSIKFSKAVGDYLVEHYHFEDKRGLPGWESWDDACEAYMQYCEMYTLPFEREHAPRFSSDIPGLKKPSVDEQSVSVAWKGIEGADGYAVFRKTSSTAWACVAEVDAGISDYTDAGLNPSTEYVYTVVPWRMNGEAREYGSFNVLGVNASTKGESA